MQSRRARRITEKGNRHVNACEHAKHKPKKNYEAIIASLSYSFIHHVFPATPYSLIYSPVLLSSFPSPSFPPKMDDLAHELPLNHRKRKAGNDDCATAESQDAHARAASEGLLVDTSAPANSKASVISPRLPWLAGGNTIWSSPSSPSTCSPVSPESEYDAYPTNPPKRQRLNAMDSSLSALTEVQCKTPTRVPDNAIRYDSKDGT